MFVGGAEDFKVYMDSIPQDVAAQIRPSSSLI